MKEICSELFINFGTGVVFLHILSAIVWIGGMIAIRFAAHFSVQTIEDAKSKLQTTLLNLKYFFSMVMVCIVVLFVTAIIMIQALELNGLIVHLKESIWFIMTLIFMVVFIKRNQAQKYFDQHEYAKAKLQLQPIAKYFIPINILLGLCALFLGIII